MNIPTNPSNSIEPNKVSQVPETAKDASKKPDLSPSTPTTNKTTSIAGRFWNWLTSSWYSKKSDKIPNTSSNNIQKLGKTSEAKDVKTKSDKTSSWWANFRFSNPSTWLPSFSIRRKAPEAPKIKTLVLTDEERAANLKNANLIMKHFNDHPELMNEVGIFRKPGDDPTRIVDNLKDNGKIPSENVNGVDLAVALKRFILEPFFDKNNEKVSLLLESVEIVDEASSPHGDIKISKLKDKNKTETVIKQLREIILDENILSTEKSEELRNLLQLLSKTSKQSGTNKMNAYNLSAAIFNTKLVDLSMDPNFMENAKKLTVIGEILISNYESIFNLQ